MLGLLREGRVRANGLRFAYLEGGSGPLVVLLHGWPDAPHTWDRQLAALVGAGFRVAAPWLRGYPPTEIPRSGYFDIGTLAVDVRELIRVLDGGDPCLLVGQDWGASIGYQVLAAFPEIVRSAVMMPVGLPGREPFTGLAGSDTLREKMTNRSGVAATEWRATRSGSSAGGNERQVVRSLAAYGAASCASGRQHSAHHPGPASITARTPASVG